MHIYYIELKKKNNKKKTNPVYRQYFKTSEYFFFSFSYPINGGQVFGETLYA